METVNVTVRMERQTRDDAAKLFSELGISTTQAINMFLKQAVREKGIPFEVTARRQGRAIPRACLRLAKFILRPAPRLMRYARKEPPCCTDMLNVRKYSAYLYS